MPLLFANAGVPMIFLQWPAMLAALIPVICLEAILVQRWLKLPAKAVWSAVAQANVVSTVAGVPLAWLASFAVEFATMMPTAMAANHFGWKLDSPIFAVVGFVLSAPWLGPDEARLHWMIPLAAAVLLVPCYFVSVWLEARVCQHALPDVPPALLHLAVRRANLASYALLFVLALGYAGFEISRKGLTQPTWKERYLQPTNSPSAHPVPSSP